MIRQGQRSIIFLINNGGYTIEVEIHDGPYNVIKNWNYTGVVDAINNQSGKCWTCKVSSLQLATIDDRSKYWNRFDSENPGDLLQVNTEEQLEESIATATGDKKDCLCFIEVIVHKDDTSKELLEWGSRVSSANSRAPNPQ